MDDLNPITRTERLLDGEDLTPTNREEMFIKRIYDKTQEIPEPVNRKEYFLKKAGEAGGDVTVVPLSVTDNGIYSEEGKAYSPVTVEVAPPEDSYQLKSITTPTSLATFEASEMPMPSLKVSVEAQQDLHGYDKPWVGGAGKNKLPLTVDGIKAANTSGTWSGNVYTYRNVTYTLETDDGNNIKAIKIGGGAASNVSFLRINYDLPAGTYYLSGCPSGGSSQTYYLSMRNDGGSEIQDTGNGLTMTSAGQIDKYCQVVIASGQDISGKSFYPMICLASEQDKSFAPYSNICPISGWDAVVVSDVDDVDNPTVTQTTTISLPQTVYGGELDVVNGTSGNRLTYGFKQGFTRGALDSSGKLYKLSPILDDVAMWTDTSRASEKIMSNMFEVMSLRDARTATTPSLSQHETSFYVGGYVGDEATLDALLSDLQIKYELATPTTLTTQPTPIKSLNGTNNLSVDCGEVIEGEYFKALGGE